MSNMKLTKLNKNKKNSKNIAVNCEKCPFKKPTHFKDYLFHFILLSLGQEVILSKGPYKCGCMETGNDLCTAAKLYFSLLHFSIISPGSLRGGVLLPH